MTSSTPTLRDVAAEAGVSPMTASNALRGKPGVKESTRAKVIAAAKRLNYRINLTASMLKSGRSNIIHVIVNEFDSPFYSKLTQALSNEIVSRGLIPFIEQTQYSPDAAEHALSSNPFSGQLFDGEILHATGLGTNVPLSKLNGGRPFVLLDACEETPTVDAVNFPNEEAERAAMQHLIDRGCRNIAIVGHRFAPRADLAHAQNAFALRLRGACGALSDAGLPYDESTVFEAGDVANGIIAGHAIAERILAARTWWHRVRRRVLRQRFRGVRRDTRARGPRTARAAGREGDRFRRRDLRLVHDAGVEHHPGRFHAACEILGRYAVRTYRSWNRRGVAAKTGHHRLPAGGPGIDRGLRMTPRWQAIRHRQQPSRPIPLNRNHSIGINRHHSSRNL